MIMQLNCRVCVFPPPLHPSKRSIAREAVRLADLTHFISGLKEVALVSLRHQTFVLTPPVFYVCRQFGNNRSLYSNVRNSNRHRA